MAETPDISGSVHVGVWRALAIGVVCGCARYEAPGGGVPKGCVDAVSFAAPIGVGLGVSSHLEWGSSDIDTAYREFETAGWAELGVASVRRDLTWSVLEPTQGSFDFAPADRVVDATESAGAELLGLLDYGNSWARSDSDDELMPPENVEDFGAYAAEVALRYTGRVRNYEVWNEPNAGVRFWHPKEDPAAYGALLVEAADRIHAVEPDARVSFGGVFYPDLVFNTPGAEFIRAVHAAVPTLADHIDALSFHPYRYPFTAPELSDEAQPSLVEVTCEVRDLVAEMGAPDLPLWNTETGWHTAVDALFTGVGEEEQAAFMVRSALLTFAQGVEIYIWYTFRDSGTNSADQEQMFGLYDYDEDPLSAPDAQQKPAAAAFSTLSKILSRHDRIEDLAPLLGLDAETYAYRLSGGGPEIIALWTTGEEVEVQVPGDGVAVRRDMWGGRTELSADKGAFTVSVTTQPCYLVPS